MAELGEVNLGAIEEVRPEERLTFLCSQRDDLLQAREGLLRVITEIDAETRERYLRTIEELRVACRGVHAPFGGGTTAIQLTDKDDALEGGLDIIVQPPARSRRVCCSLGGERAPTATAFLFALLRIKPSPFVLLDEVDAPLDESNVRAEVAARVRAARSLSSSRQQGDDGSGRCPLRRGDARTGRVACMSLVRLEELPDAARAGARPLPLASSASQR